jgi:predicted nucleotidyltransferase
VPNDRRPPSSTQSASPERTREVEAILRAATDWASGRPLVRALALVGSWARREANMGSDLDLVILSDEPGRFIGRDEWGSLVGNARFIRRQAWGIVVELRLELASGLEVELDVAPAAWARVPLDAGTRRVLADGARSLHDPEGLLQRALGSLTTAR